MKKMLVNNKAQNIIEFSIVLGVIVSIFVVMQAYLKRGIQAGIKISADQLGRQVKGLPETDAREEAVGNFHSNTSTPEPSVRRKQVSLGGNQAVATQETKETQGEGRSTKLDSGWYYTGDYFHVDHVLHRQEEKQ